MLCKQLSAHRKFKFCLLELSGIFPQIFSICDWLNLQRYYSSQGSTGPTVVLHYRNKLQFIYDSITEGHLNWIMFLLLLPTVLPCTFLLPKVYIQEWICWLLRDIQHKIMLTVSKVIVPNAFSQPHAAWELPLLGLLAQIWF